MAYPYMNKGKLKDGDSQLAGCSNRRKTKSARDPISWRFSTPSTSTRTSELRMKLKPVRHRDGCHAESGQAEGENPLGEVARQ